MSPWKIRASDTSETNSNDERVVEPGMRDALGLDSTEKIPESCPFDSIHSISASHGCGARRCDEGTGRRSFDALPKSALF